MEQNAKSAVVKAFIDFKKGVLQLEGPQEFVEKYLDSTVKNCKPFAASSPKPKPTAEEQEKTKQYKNSVAESLVTLSIGLFTVALLNRTLAVSGKVLGWYKVVASGWYYVAYLGIISLFFGLYFVFPSHNRQEWLIRNIFNKSILKAIKLYGWAIVLVLFGEGLIKTIQSDWAAIIGLICIAAGCAVLIYGIFLSICRPLEESIFKKHKNA